MGDDCGNHHSDDGSFRISSGLCQCIYRVGDALTNSVNPIFYYLPLILGVVQKYKKDAGVGTVVAYQIPYFLGYSVVWTAMLILWYVMGWNLGPMAPVML